MLIVSREARVKAAKHAWNSCGRSAFGLLIGTRTRLFLSLPATSVRTWKEYRPDQFEDTFLRPARQLAASLHMTILGCYASSETGSADLGECPFENDQLFMSYHMLCCPQCSGATYHVDGKMLPSTAILVAPAKRLTPLLNQRRILTQWNKLLGRSSYLDDNTERGDQSPPAYPGRREEEKTRNTPIVAPEEASRPPRKAHGG